MSRRTSIVNPRRVVGQVLAACLLLVTTLVAGACQNGSLPCIPLPGAGMCPTPDASACAQLTTPQSGDAYACNLDTTTLRTPQDSILIAATRWLLGIQTPVPGAHYCGAYYCTDSGTSAEQLAASDIGMTLSQAKAAGLQCVRLGTTLKEVDAVGPGVLSQWQPPAVCLAANDTTKPDAGVDADAGGMCAMVYGACVIEPDSTTAPGNVCCPGLHCSGDYSDDVTGYCCHDLEEPCTYGTDCCGPYLDLPIPGQSLLECGRAGGNHPGVCCEATGSGCELALNECCTGSCVSDGSDPDYGTCQ